MRIPTSFNLIDETITVKTDPTVALEDSCGLSEYRTNTIRLSPDNLVNPMTPHRTEQVFLHELVHFILYAMKEDDLRKNEKFVDTFACLLHQAILTSNFNPKGAHR